MNPVLNEKTFSGFNYSEDAMTIGGVINKSFLLWLVLAAGAYLGWTNATLVISKFWPIFIVTLILCLIISFVRHTSPYLSPLYAFGEGLFLGAITLFFEKDYPGIAVNAVFLTVAVLFCMLAAFKSGKIRATNKFKKVIVISTLAIAGVYLIDIILSLCHVPGITLIHSSGPLGILISVGVVIIAALNLILDFDMIQRGVARQAPKYMEWYSSFALMVTIIWLYLEILRLLSKIRR